MSVFPPALGADILRVIADSIDDPSTADLVTVSIVRETYATPIVTLDIALHGNQTLEWLVDTLHKR